MRAPTASAPTALESSPMTDLRIFPGPPEPTPQWGIRPHADSTYGKGTLEDSRIDAFLDRIRLLALDNEPELLQACSWIPEPLHLG